MHLDEFLAEEAQLTRALVCVLQVIPGDSTRIDIIPVRGGCACGSRLRVRRSQILSVTPTSRVIRCCGANRAVVTVRFVENAAFSVEEVLDMLQTGEPETDESAGRVGTTPDPDPFPNVPRPRWPPFPNPRPWFRGASESFTGRRPPLLERKLCRIDCRNRYGDDPESLAICLEACDWID